MEVMTQAALDMFAKKDPGFILKLLPFFKQPKAEKHLHPGRWTAGTYSHHPFRNENDLPTEPP